MSETGPVSMASAPNTCSLAATVIFLEQPARLTIREQSSMQIYHPARSFSYPIRVISPTPTQQAKERDRLAKAPG